MMHFIVLLGLEVSIEILIVSFIGLVDVLWFICSTREETRSLNPSSVLVDSRMKPIVLGKKTYHPLSSKLTISSAPVITKLAPSCYLSRRYCKSSMVIALAY